MSTSATWELVVDKAEFAALNRQLVSFFRRRCRSNDDPEDLAADTWMGVFRWFKGKCSLRHFVFYVAYRRLIASRRKKRIVMWPLPEGSDGHIDVCVEGPGLDSLLMQAARYEAMDRALEQVTEECRDVIVLWLKDWDNYQIAAELGIAFNTVRSRLSRGKAQLVTALVGTAAELDA